MVLVLFHLKLHLRFKMYQYPVLISLETGLFVIKVLTLFDLKTVRMVETSYANYLTVFDSARIWKVRFFDFPLPPSPKNECMREEDKNAQMKGQTLVQVLEWIKSHANRTRLYREK